MEREKPYDIGWYCIVGGVVDTYIIGSTLGLELRFIGAPHNNIYIYIPANEMPQPGAQPTTIIEKTDITKRHLPLD